MVPHFLVFVYTHGGGRREEGKKKKRDRRRGEGRREEVRKNETKGVYLGYLYLDISIFPSRSLTQDLHSKFTISPNLNLSLATASTSTQRLPGNL